MCFGAAVSNRIAKVVYAATDPWGGMSQFNSELPLFYREVGTELVSEPSREEAYKLLRKSIEHNSGLRSWIEMLEKANTLT